MMLPIGVWILLFWTQVVYCLSVLSRPIKTSYNQLGQIQSFTVPFKLFGQDIYQSDLLTLTFPQALHTSNNYIQFSLISTTQLVMIPLAKSLTPVTIGTEVKYMLPLVSMSNNSVKHVLSSAEWYQVTVYVKSVLSISYGLVRIQLSSGDDINHIVYNKDAAFEYYFLNSLGTISPVNMNLQVSNTVSYSPSAIYPVHFEITPTMLSQTPTTLKLAFSNTTYNGITFTIASVTQNYFVFQGTCEVLCDNSGCQPLNSCIVSNLEVSIQIPYFNQTFTVELWVRNPDFVSSVGIEAYWFEESGTIGGYGLLNNVLSVGSIQFTPEEVKLFWGIPYSQVQNMGLGIFLGDTVNTFDIGFSITAGTPISTIFTVKVQIGANGVLDSSINHNLPSSSYSKIVQCSYANPYILCINVGAFTRFNYRYYIRAKGQFTTSSPITNFGSITIKHQKDNTLSLIDPIVQTLSINVIPNADYHDFIGIHSDNYRIEDTMVVGSYDSLLPNSSSNSLRDFLTSNDSFVGIDPTIIQQQLIFLLKVNPIQMASASASQNYTMRVFMNSKAIKSSSPKGIDFGAFNSTSKSWEVQSSPCYFDSTPTLLTNQTYMCQKYQDHVANQQIDNVLATSTYYSYYQWVCGAGTYSVCTSGNCEIECNVFRGYAGGLAGMGQGDGGYFAIRNVTFADNYHSPTLASDLGLDFIIIFYHGGTIVSASLINAYTLNRDRLNYMTVGFVNKYNDGSKVNDGSRIPTMLQIKGYLSLTQFPSQEINSFEVFFPSTISVDSFVQTNESIGCSFSCKAKKITGVAMTAIKNVDTWVNQANIQVRNLSVLIQAFSILVPVRIDGNVHSIILVMKNNLGSILRVYRFNGSAVGQSLTPTSIPKWNIAQNFLPTITWDTTSSWVSEAGYSYNQGLDMSRILKSSPYNTIGINSSVLPNNSDGSCTFSTSYESIFSISSVASINSGTSICIGPFNYLYSDLSTSYRVYLIWCKTTPLSLNTINVTYPLYPVTMGSQFAYYLAFSYGFSSKDGYLSAYRIQSGNRLTTSQCQTSKTTEYYLQIPGTQSNIFQTDFSPFLLSPGKFSAFQLEITIPTGISLVIQNPCQIYEVYAEIEFVCTFDSSSGNSFRFNAMYLGNDIISVLKVQVKLRTIKTVDATILVVKPYTFAVYLPQTQTNTLASVYYGQLFTPYKSKIFQCSNGFTFSSQLPSKTIIITSHKIPILEDDIMASDSYIDISATLMFSLSWSAFLESSLLKVTFSQAILDTAFSKCLISPNWHQWQTFTIISSTSFQLTPKQTIPSFTALEYTLLCKNVKLICPLQMIVEWFDSGSVVQQSTNTLLNCPSVLSSTPSTLTIVEKLFATSGFQGGYKLRFSMNVDGLNSVEMYILMADRNYRYSILDCWYLHINGSYIPIYCRVNNREEIYVEFQPAASSSFLILIHGIHQQPFPTLNIHTLVYYSNASYVFNTLDTLPSSINPTNIPIIISNISVIQTMDSSSTLDIFSLKIVFYFPVLFSDNRIFVVVDEILAMTNSYHAITTCQINGSAQNCLRISKNIIQIQLALGFNAGELNTLTLGPLYKALLPSNQIDGEYLHFIIFTSDSTQNNVLRSSLTFIDDPIPRSILQYPSEVGSLYWNLTAGSIHKIYHGYYGPTIALVPNTTTSSQTINKFVNNFGLIPMYDTSIYSTLNVSIQLGYPYFYLSLGVTPNRSIGIYSNIEIMDFSHPYSFYNQIQGLPVLISTQKCKVRAEMASYGIYTGGITLPILLNFTLCRPIFGLTLTYTPNSSRLTIDSSLTNKIVNQLSPLAYVLLRHDFNTTTVGNPFSMGIALSGTYSQYYQAIPSVTITVVGTSTIVGNPQAKDPDITLMVANLVHIKLQCNQPSTIYWTVALFPESLGIVVEQIQARLVEGGQGLRNKVNSIYEWNQIQYGFSYAFYANTVIELTVDQLQGNRDYVFKYFCVNQLGRSSGGKIKQFKTPTSNYSIVKLFVYYKSNITGVLNYSQNNQLACAIAQTLIVPFTDVLTSTFSNCKHNPEIIYNNNTLFSDEYSEQLRQHTYLFYIDTNSLSSQDVESLLATKLRLARAFQSGDVPLWREIKVSQLSSNQVPVLKNISYIAKTQSLNITLAVGIEYSYAVAGIMRQQFDNLTMSIPKQYLIKQGIFSNNTRFDKVVMKYGRNNISMQFTDLIDNSYYSVFYFVTVDNPALDSRNTEVKLLQLRTAANLLIDLHSSTIKSMVLLIILITLASSL